MSCQSKLKMKDYDKHELSYRGYYDINNFYEWAMPQKLSTSWVQCLEETSQLNEISYKATLRIVMNNIFVDI